MNGKELKRLAGLVSSQNACGYALANGWRRVEYGDGGIALFDRADSELDQLIIPLHPTGPDYSRRIVDVLMNLSEVEHRPAEEVVNDLLMPGADVIRYRIISPDTDKGDVSLEDGLRILKGARGSLLSAACSVHSPVNHHPRMSHTEATQFLDTCRLRQTERGSFTVAIACPLNAEESLFDAHEPFTRQATEMLMRSANRLVKSIESGKWTPSTRSKPTHRQSAPIFVRHCYTCSQRERDRGLPYRSRGQARIQEMPVQRFPAN